MDTCEEEALEHLEGQVGSAKISLARLSSPLLYFVLSGNDFSLDINNPDEPKYLNRVFRILPKKNHLKCAIIADEFSSIFANGIENFLAIARGYKINTYLVIQNLAQLRKSYGKEHADVLFSLAGNVISGQATGETAKDVSEIIGKLSRQEKASQLIGKTLP